MTDRTKKRVNYFLIVLVLLAILFFEDIKRFIYNIN